jgi:hypothetical protein
MTAMTLFEVLVADLNECVTAEGRQDNLPDISCPKCRALILKYL